MKKQLFVYAIGLLMAGMLAACSSDDDMFSFDSKNEVLVKSISADEFNKCALGHGWKVTAMYELYDDGTCDHENFYSKDRLGRGEPEQFEFSEGKVVVYSRSPMYPGTYSESSMRYDGIQQAVFQWYGTV